MIKLYRTVKLFFHYRKMLKNNREYLANKYSLDYNRLYELYTTIILTDAPDEMKQKYGKALADFEIKKYITNFNKDLPKMELEELVNIYEIKKINDDLYGIAFGFALMSNRKMYLLLSGIILLLVLLITCGIIFL